MLRLQWPYFAWRDHSKGYNLVEYLARDCRDEMQSARDVNNLQRGKHVESDILLRNLHAEYVR